MTEAKLLVIIVVPFLVMAAPVVVPVLAGILLVLYIFYYESLNFKLKNDDKHALVNCPECHKENYAVNVLSGVCTWCGFDINGEDEE